MTVTADSKKRVVVPLAKPGDRFDVQVSADGAKIVMTLLEPTRSRPAKIKIEKRNGFTVGVSNRALNEQALKAALAEFP